MFSLIPTPLHPAVVHLPIALALLIPLFAIGALWAIRRGARPRVAWGITTALLAALVGSAWLSIESGESQEERVEDVVSERALETHEEAAQLFLALSAGVLVVAAAGLVKGVPGKVARVAATVGTVGLIGAGWNVGHSGGQLVYRDGAASAYTNGSGSRSGEAGGERARASGGENRRGDRAAADADD